MPTYKSNQTTSSKESTLEKISESEDKILHYLFPLLSQQKKLIHSIFTRQGGVSSPPYNYLNTGYNTDDHPGHVSTNLDIIKNNIGAKHLLSMNQVHGRDIFTLRRTDMPNPESMPDADAMVTDIPGLALMVKQADCQAIILYDANYNVLANLHCGWRGNCFNIPGTVVGHMKSQFGSNPSDLKAAISPSLGPCCAEFTTYRDIFPKTFNRFMVKENYFNLWEISRMQLLGAGVMEENIEIANICTKCNTDLFYSYRAEGITGRFATVAMLID
ncbi:peptidoglycan editing factor PgeF [Thermodesulfobacteriota bacterium]